MRRSLSLRITASIAGLMVAAVAIAIAGLYWAAGKTDQSAIHSERGLLRNALQIEKERISKRVESLATGDATYHHAHICFDRAWMETYIGQRLSSPDEDNLVALAPPTGGIRTIAITGT